MTEFKALLAREGEDGKVTAAIESRKLSELANHEVLIEVHFAALNYKDALSATGHRGVTRNYPHTPGVDASGIVVSDSTGTFDEGDEVICTSFDLGMNTDGGFAEYIRVPANWVVPLPEGLDLKEAMIMGTAAFTAGLALHKMERCGLHPSNGPVVVSGATGGVGSMAVAILAKAKYEVVASSGKTDKYEYLTLLGASECISRTELDDKSGRPLLKSRWAGAIDNVGGNTLATILKSCKKEACVASIGLVGSPQFEITVYPFILNGVNLLGVDSAETELNLRKVVWEKLAHSWKPDHLLEIGTEVLLEEIPHYIDRILRGETVGRVVAKVKG